MILAIKNYLKRFRFLLTVYDYYRLVISYYLYKKSPSKAADYVYYKEYHRHLDLVNPTHFDDRILWCLYNTNTELWSKCADKYRVREFVEERGCSGLLNVLYGVWDKGEDINFNLLPSKYVLKTNNGCNTNLIIKGTIDYKKTRQTLNRWLKFPYGYIGGQTHYLAIKPCIIGEKYLDNNKAGDLIDYKFYCFDGHVECLMVCTERDIKKHSFKVDFFDLDWIKLNVTLWPSNHEIEKPLSFEQMVEASKKLSKGFPFVRIDFYDINGTAIFGEMTFTPDMCFVKQEYSDYLASLIKIIK